MYIRLVNENQNTTETEQERRERELRELVERRLRLLGNLRSLGTRR